MKKSYLGLVLLFILLTTYAPSFNLGIKSNLKIKNIIIENNSILESIVLKKKLNFLYEENLFFLNKKKVKDILRREDFIENYAYKKIYPNTIKFFINEKKPIAILYFKKNKYYVSDKGELINFIKLPVFKDLPTVYGNSKDFYTFYQDLQNIKFPIKMIKSFYFFESGRWDIILRDDKIIKLPVKDYIISLKSFMLTKTKESFNNYKKFDYRISDQLILN